MLPPLLANTLWYLLALPDSRAFRRAVHDVARTQERLLLRLLHQHAGSDWGRRFGFASIRSAADYQQRVPLSRYEDYHEAVQQIGAGRPHVLTCEPVLLLEPTSGSSAASKYIPYTASLKAEFQRAIAPWMADLFGHDAALLCGRSYWSVTPIARQMAQTPGGVPIGFEEESAYFGWLQRALVQSVMAVPSLVRLIDDMPAFRYITLLFLLRSRSLTLISVWNPTFLLLLVAPLADWWPRLAADIASGNLSSPSPLPESLHRQLVALNRPDPRRAAEICAAFLAGGPPGAMHRRLWPRLRLISCWADAYAARYVPELAQLFPQARVQGKGLLATEGCVSFPLAGCVGMPLALRSHFFEFLPAEPATGQTAGGRALLAHELAAGCCYEVVLTTGGGLYRYRLADLVEVTGYLAGCPLLRFVGKAGHISDRFGEKLHEQHVQRALDSLLPGLAGRPAFVMLACAEYGGCSAYTLFIEVQAAADEELARLAQELDRLLQENYHYRYCRDLGQLGALRVFRITSGALESYLAACQAHGQRAGDIKPVVLHLRGGWQQVFRGRLLSAEAAVRPSGIPSQPRQS